MSEEPIIYEETATKSRRKRVLSRGTILVNDKTEYKWEKANHTKRGKIARGDRLSSFEGTMEQVSPISIKVTQG